MTQEPKHWFYLITLTLGLSLFGLIFWKTWQYWQAPPKIDLTQTHHSTPSKTQGLDNVHLFGKTADLANLPLSTLPFIIQGIAYSEDANSPSIVILQINNQISAYQVGQVLAPGVILVGITPNEIIISEHDELSRLILFKTPKLTPKLLTPKLKPNLEPN